MGRKCIGDHKLSNAERTKRYALSHPEKIKTLNKIHNADKVYKMKYYYSNREHINSLRRELYQLNKLKKKININSLLLAS